MKNIFIIGKAGSGKDTAALYLMQKHGVNVFTLAEPIRKRFKELYPDLNPRLNRDKLIELGQGYKKLYGMDYWVKLTMNGIDKHLDANPKDYVLISDGRYQVEYDFFVKQQDFFPIRIVCPNEIQLQRLKARDGTAQEDALLMESTELDDDYATPIYNSTDESFLYLQLDALVKSI